MAFRVYFPMEGLYLDPSKRVGWKRSIVFIEPSSDPTRMAVLSLLAVPETYEVSYPGVEGCAVAVLDLSEGMVMHVLVTFHQTIVGAPGMDAVAAEITGAKMPEAAESFDNPIVVALGNEDSGARFLVPLPLKAWARDDGTAQSSVEQANRAERQELD
ncbi:MAG: hypothetical protein HGA39_09825 [Coriobacteriia bacterium]|nr:hypothetical protein [Coriobacteriia bacterium]